MSIAPSLSPSASRFWSPSRSMFRGVLSWRLLLRAIWLATGIAYLCADLTAEIAIRRAADGTRKLPEQLLAEVNWAVSWFPLDPQLRRMRRYLVREVVKQERLP